MHRQAAFFLHIPEPTPVPDRVLRVMGRPTNDDRDPEFVELGLRAIAGM
jgi:alanine-glyoxylate transaminase/serine-glyoxylate transaminase/serine-pyruvate transaminase